MSAFKVFSRFAVAVALVVGLSWVSFSLLPEKQEKTTAAPEVALQPGMTVKALGEKYQIPVPVLKEVFKLQSQEDMGREVASFGLTEERLKERLKKAYAFAAEEGSKSWVRIAAKFALWLVFLLWVFKLMRSGRIGPRARLGLYAGSVALFGVVLGADPSPMGTVKDAIALYGRAGIIFPPRMIALSAFLAAVILANKFICGWGCQFGTFQDLIFRLNRDKADRKGLVGQVKLPFALTNGIRMAVFAVFTIAAFAWGVDLIKPVDPFSIFKPQTLGILGAAFIALLVVASLFVYRPWCHLFCPFGLVGWVAERAALVKIRVDKGKCVSCGACAKACPSTVMGAILEEKRTIPDCFACAACLDVCPEGAVRFCKGKPGKSRTE